MKIRKFFWGLLISAYRRRDPQATHVFYFSKKQDALNEHENVKYFKGKPYTVNYSLGFGNNYPMWPDAVLLGCGTFSDIEFGTTNYKNRK